MAFTPLFRFRTVAAVLVLGALLTLAAPRAWAQDATPTPAVAATSAATAEATLPATEAPPSGSATITAVDTSAFPALRAYMLVDDVNGARVAALTQSSIDLSENGVPVRGLTVREAEVGVQVVFVIDANDAFSARDINGITRLQYIEQALNTFVTSAPQLKPGLDLVTLLAAEGPLLERADNPALLTQALANYQTGYGGSADPFPLLHRALTYALDVAPRPAMRRYVVYFSNGWNRFDIDAGVADIAARANGLVPIYTVFVGPIGADNTLGSQNLLRLAEATGGERIIFNGPGALAPLFQQLADDGRQYELSYRSTLAVTGQHTLAAQVRLPGTPPLVSNEAIFPLRVEAPLLALSGVPPSVVRVAASHDADLAAADPAALDIALTLDFPDGHPRGVRLAQLLVDGQVVMTQTAPSQLTTLTWPLGAFTQAGEHQLQARLIDELGLAAESEVVPVSLSLQVPPAPPNAALPPLQASREWPLMWMALGGLGLAAAIGLGAWWWLARRQRLADALLAEALDDEVTLAAPVVKVVKRAHGAAPAAVDTAPAPRPAARLALPRVPSLRWAARGPTLAPPKGTCYFEVVEAGGGGAARPHIEVAAPLLNLGRDAAVADTVFHDRSVSRLHARVLLKDRRVTVVDQGSTSGTWVNYTPVQGEAGCELHHGDLVNLGRVQLRFLRRDAPPSNGSPVRVTPAVPALTPPGVPGAAAPDKVDA